MEGENKPSPSNPKYVIGRYEFREPWDEVRRKAGIKDLGGSETFAKLLFDSISDAKRVIEMAKLNKEGWYIMEVTDPNDTYRGKVVAQHPRVTQVEEDAEISKARNEFKQHIRAAAINLGPKTLVLNIGKAQFTFSRGVAEYSPRYSSKVQTGVSISVKTPNAKRDYFSPSNWITESGAVQKKAFLRDERYLFDEVDILAVADRLKDLRDIAKRMAQGNLTSQELEAYDVTFGTEHLREPVVVSPKEAKILPSVADLVLRTKFNKGKLKAKPVQSEVSGGR